MKHAFVSSRNLAEPRPDRPRHKFSRRGLLRTAGLALAAGVAGPAARLATAEPLSPAVPARARLPVHIRQVRVFLFPWRAVLVRLDTDAGISGWGECSPMAPRTQRAMIEEKLVPRILGKNVFDIETLWDEMFWPNYKSGAGGILTQCIAGVDIALWDVVGKLLGLPVSTLLGGRRRDRIRVYGSYGRRSKGAFRPPVEMARIAAGLVDEGFTSVKARMQWRQTRVDPREDPVFDVAREVRAAIGDDVELMIDANNGYSVHRAIRVARGLGEYGVVQFEEPVSQHNYPAMKQVVEATDTPISAGEHEFNRWQFRDLITLGQPDILNPDVSKCGGLTEARRIATLAATFDRPIVVHNTHPTVNTAASLHFVATIQNSGGYAQEYPGTRKRTVEVLRTPLAFADGHLEVPTAPGLGIDIDPAAVDRLAE